MEFYFSDSNLPIDDFLKKTVTESEDGCKFRSLCCYYHVMMIYCILNSVSMFGFGKNSGEFGVDLLL